jgi:hypothetical protein
LGTEQNPEDSSEIVFSEDVLRLGGGGRTPSFFESITLTMAQEKLFCLEKIVDIYLEAEFIFF